MRLVLSRRATRNIAEIANHVHAQNPAAAVEVGRAVRDALDLPTVYPHAGRSVGHGVRALAVPRLPYLVYYRVDATVDALTVITLRHAARRRLF